MCSTVNQHFLFFIFLCGLSVTALAKVYCNCSCLCGRTQIIQFIRITVVVSDSTNQLVSKICFCTFLPVMKKNLVLELIFMNTVIYEYFLLKRGFISSSTLRCIDKKWPLLETVKKSGLLEKILISVLECFPDSCLDLVST
jgi:hypothetical protein